MDGKVEVKQAAGDVASEIEELRYEMRFRFEEAHAHFEQRTAEVKLDIVLSALATVLCAYLVIKAMSLV